MLQCLTHLYFKQTAQSSVQPHQNTSGTQIRNMGALPVAYPLYHSILQSLFHSGGPLQYADCSPTCEHCTH